VRRHGAIMMGLVLHSAVGVCGGRAVPWNAKQSDVEVVARRDEAGALR